jgi:hypothetical protein
MADLTADEVLARWRRIRANPDCELSLEPDSVARFLRRPESEIVRSRIQESLGDLARYRLQKEEFVSDRPAGGGDLASCEGLETFLVPAVEEVMAFSDLLATLPDSSRTEFAAAIAADFNSLVKNWAAGRFSGAPYGNQAVLKKALRPDLKAEMGELNNTETAAFACRVLVHVLALLERQDQERLFIETVGKGLDRSSLLAALKRALEFLVEAFQKNEADPEAERRHKIVTARIESVSGSVSGSGWSWTARHSLPPMLFFTASVVDAFAELDLYLIRPQRQGDLASFYADNQRTLEDLELCVDMARRWIINAVLPWLSQGTAQYVEEKLPLEVPYATESANYEGSDFKTLSGALNATYGLRHPPIVYYNNIYALLILLWSFADWDASGQALNMQTKTAIDQALAQIVRRYTTPEIRSFITRFPNVFYLPGEQIFVDGKKARCEYLDSAFLPLLTRLLVLFVVYGVGDRNLLEPVIRSLYVELMQNRYRSGDYSGLWSEANIELYATQRAVQALTFYYAYARGRELQSSPGDRTSSLVLRNATGLNLDLVLEARLVPDRPSPPPGGPAIKGGIWTQEKLVAAAKDGFLGFCRSLPGYEPPKMLGLDPERDANILVFLKDIEALGDAVITDIRGNRIVNMDQAHELLSSLSQTLSHHHEIKDRVGVLDELRTQHKALAAG